tara:strand:- start:71 stop:820 length:750 start_codon:yes stop_codon:yes gene_type:complete
MDEPVLMYVLLIGLSVLGIFQNSVSFNPLRFHCNNYIFSTYLYFILSWGIALATVTGMSQKKLDFKKIFTGPFMVLMFICSILLLVGISITPPEMFFTKHILFILEIILLGITLYPLYSINKDRFNHVGLTTLLVLTVLSLIVYINPNLISDNIVTYLFIGLLALVIARVVELIFVYNNSQVNSTYSKAINYFVIVLFSLYIMFDTKSIIKNANECKVSPFGPDYIREAINLFLDTINMFSGVYHVQND